MFSQDERHRQVILRQIKCNARRHQLAVKATCWLSVTQQQNKTVLYQAVATANGTITTQDWGDRVLLMREAIRMGEAPRRWVATIDGTMAALLAAMEMLWKDWGLRWTAATAQAVAKPC